MFFFNLFGSILRLYVDRGLEMNVAWIVSCIGCMVLSAFLCLRRLDPGLCCLAGMAVLVLITYGRWLTTGLAEPEVLQSRLLTSGTVAVLIAGLTHNNVAIHLAELQLVGGVFFAFGEEPARMAFSLAAIASLATQLTMIAWHGDSAEAKVRWVCASCGFVPLVVSKALILFQHTEFVTALLAEWSDTQCYAVAAVCCMVAAVCKWKSWDADCRPVS